MWIPIVVILWQLGPAQVWLNFPQPTFPFESLEICEQFTNKVRENIMMNPIYIDGWSACVEVPKQFNMNEETKEEEQAEKIPL